MTGHVEFAYLPIDRLREHEETQADRVEEVLRDIERRGIVDEPILVARGSHVVLNGHHRFAALRLLGAKWVPVYLIDYENGSVLLERWTPGPPISKTDVVRTASEGRLYPPKTTRHRLLFDVLHRPTPLRELLETARPVDAPGVRVGYGASRPEGRDR
ncbi:MAG TPA: ParB N-terminal domain-containing protein [Thermoplasmata archaeon]|nr:ParB N-terminal domain-containing protein [Thermoplasmata archaeon]